MRKLTDLTTDQVSRIAALYGARGADPATVSRVAKTWQITESDARALGTAATTTAPKKAVTESAPDLTAAAALDPDASRKAALAFRLQQQVNEADARIDADGGSLAGLSIQSLEALAAAAGADAGMFGG